VLGLSYKWMDQPAKAAAIAPASDTSVTASR
jgi:hypothetical protein